MKLLKKDFFLLFNKEYIRYHINMISIETLALERTECINKKEDSYRLKLLSFKDKCNKKLDNDIYKYSLNHNEEETLVFKDERTQFYSQKIEEKETKYRKRSEHFTRSSEVRSKTVYRESKRVWEIDFLRGIAIWGMIVDHYMYDFATFGFFPIVFKSNGGTWLNSFGQFASLYWTHDLRVGVRLFGVFLFIFLCGLSTKFAKNNLKRALEITGVGLAITIALNIFAFISNDTHYNLLLSTIFMIGFCLLIYTGISTLFKKICGDKYWKWVCLAITISMFIFWAILSFSSYLAQGHPFIQLKERWYFVFNDNGDDVGWRYGFNWLNSSGYNWLSVILGLSGFGVDWLGLFPYLAYMFLGGFVGETLYSDKKSIIKYFFPKEERSLSGDEYLATKQGQLNARLNRIFSPVSYPGRHTMFVYVFHQPVFIAIMTPIFLLTGYTISLF